MEDQNERTSRETNNVRPPGAAAARSGYRSRASVNCCPGAIRTWPGAFSLGLAYLAVSEDISGPSAVPAHQRVTPALRDVFRSTLMVNAGYDAASGGAAVASGAADLVAYASLFLANPDLARRFKDRAPLNEPDQATFYTGEETGYV